MNLILIVSDKPTPSTLNDHVIPLVAPNWYALGKQLLGDKHIQKLDQIQNDCRENTVKGCTEMFNTWLKADQNVSWEKLIKELKASQLPDEVSQLSDKIKEMTVKGGVGTYICTTNTACLNTYVWICMYIWYRFNASLHSHSSVLMSMSTRELHSACECEHKHYHACE